MSKFIKLTTLIINTNNIQSIFIKPNKYIIHIVSNKIDVSMWNVAGFGSGNISSYNNEIEVCETEHPCDYKIVSHWIDNNSTSYL